MLCDEELFAAQREELRVDHRVLCVLVDGADLGQEARALHEELAARRITRCTLGGVSMGGSLAQRFAFDFPGMLRGLILAHTRCRPDDAAGREKRETAIRALRQGRFEELWPEFRAALLGPDSLEDKGLCQRLAAMFRRLGAGLWEQQQACLLQRRGTCEALGALDMPSLVLAAAADRISPPHEMKELAHRLPQARWRLLPGQSGHLGPMESPKAFSAYTREFLESLPQ